MLSEEKLGTAGSELENFSCHPLSFLYQFISQALTLQQFSCFDLMERRFWWAVILPLATPILKVLLLSPIKHLLNFNASSEHCALTVTNFHSGFIYGSEYNQKGLLFHETFYKETISISTFSASSF